MPVPLILLASPLLPMIGGPALSSISAAVATAIGLGAGAGGVAVGVTTTSLWSTWFSKSSSPSQEHQDLLAAQNRITEERINNVSVQIEQLTQEATALKQEIKEATQTTISAERLNELSERIAETNEKLTAAMEIAKEASASLSESLPELKELSDASHIKAITAATMLGELNEFLQVKVDVLIQTANDIKTLQHTLNEQTVTITQLGETVQSLTVVNNAQRETIKKQDDDIAKLIQVSTTLRAQCGFFKERYRPELAQPLQPSGPAL
jgi:triphosphoribosyl-dephospho-CoA synthetase